MVEVHHKRRDVLPRVLHEAHPPEQHFQVHIYEYYLLLPYNHLSFIYEITVLIVNYRIILLKYL